VYVINITKNEKEMKKKEKKERNRAKRLAHFAIKPYGRLKTVHSSLYNLRLMWHLIDCKDVFDGASARNL